MIDGLVIMKAEENLAHLRKICLSYHFSHGSSFGFSKGKGQFLTTLPVFAPLLLLWQTTIVAEQFT